MKKAASLAEKNKSTGNGNSFGRKKKRKLVSTETSNEARDDGIAPAKIAKLKQNDPDPPEPLKLTIPVPPKKVKGFSWSQYLEQEKGIAAPSKLFKDVSPCYFRQP